MERLEATMVRDALASVATVPTGAKWEVINVAVAADGTHAYEWYLFVLTTDPTYYGLDEITVAAGKFFVNRSYQSVVLYEGESLVAWPVAGTGPDEAIVVTYVEVEPG